MYYYYDESGVTGFEYNGAKYHYIKNLQGDVVEIYDGNGHQAVQYTYDAWGNVISITGTQASTVGQINPFRYRGYYYDTETGFYYLQSRYYDPTVGRFLNADGIELLYRGLQNVSQNNMFAYCFSNPIAYIDPTGAFPILNYLRDFFEEAVDVLNGGLVSTAIKYYNYYNNEKQQSAIPNGYIDDQNKVDYMRLGGFGAGWNGCGWIAAYNAMIMIGNPQQAADVIRFFDRAGNTILYGTFGVSPTAISEYLGSQKLTGKMNTVPFVMPNNIETVAKQATACILLYIHDSGAHYVALQWNGTEYIVYNSPGFEYASIEEYINYVGTFVTIWCID